MCWRKYFQKKKKNHIRNPTIHFNDGKKVKFHLNVITYLYIIPMPLNPQFVALNMLLHS